MLLRWLASLRLDISVGPSWIGRTCGRWMLDCFLPERAGYISAAVPRYPMMPMSSYTALREAARLAEAAVERGQPPAGLNAYLHEHPAVMTSWLGGWQDLPPPDGPGALWPFRRLASPRITVNHLTAAASGAPGAWRTP